MSLLIEIVPEVVVKELVLFENSTPTILLSIKSVVLTDQLPQSSTELGLIPPLIYNTIKLPFL